MKTWITLLLFLITSLIFVSCSEEPVLPEPQNPQTESASCISCHTNYSVLKAVYTPDPPNTGGAGCGGETPHYEPYDRVYLSGDGFNDFKNSVHGKLPCTNCHNGVDNTSDKTIAHSNNFLKKPSEKSEEKCGNCHNDIAHRTKNSLHEQGWGQKSMVALRSGLANIPEGFDQLSDLMKKGYKENCAKCHASCGDCHVNRPPAGGGGLASGHQFTKTPDMRNVCVTCHVSRGGHAYFGQAIGTQPDVHLTKKQFTCLNCHSKDEIHGDGEVYDQRYKMKMMPKCVDCHSTTATSNSYHSIHFNSFSCNTCHSQDYNNCGSCHIGGEGARIHAYQGFKIGINPIPETKPYKFTLLRRSLMAQDSWKEYGVPTLPNFNVKPTFKYTTPHNILRWTSRTTVEAGKPCFDACHIINNGNGTYRNKELYLFESDLLDWEKIASQSVIVDNKLPSSWGF